MFIVFLFLFASHIFASSWCNAVISHQSCDYDSNCGMTCDQLFWSELSKDPSVVYTPDFYADFMAMCVQFYFPGVCPGGSSGDSGSSGFSPGDSSGTVWLRLAGVDSASYSHFWKDFGLGFSDVAPFVWSLLGLFIVVRILHMALK